MTTVAHDTTNRTFAPCATTTATHGKQSGWLGTSCGLCSLAALTLIYIPAVLPFVALSCALRMLRGR